MVKLSVIIPTYNRRYVIERTLQALAAQDLPPENFEVIVVVDGSTDGTVELLRTWKCNYTLRVLEKEHLGPAAARNAGIRAASGKLILFLDDDLLATPDLLRRHSESHPDSQARVVHGRIYVAPDSSPTIIRRVSEDFYISYYHSLDPEMELHYPQEFTGSVSVLSSLVNSSMPRDILLRCGGFDEEILAAEDLELGVRLWKIGASFRCQPNAVVYEHYVKSSCDYLRGQAVASGAGDLRTSRKHPEYRRCSQLSSLAETGALKKYARRALMQLPVSPASLLAFPLQFEKWFYRFTLMRNLGLRLLRYADTMARFRGAMKAAGSWKALEDEFDRRVPILLYHHVGPWRPGTYHSLTVSPKKFERQMRWLARRGYVAISPCDWFRWRKDGTALPKKPIILTFDDAYQDIAEFALPVVRRHGLSAVVFVVTSQLGGTNAWDEATGCGTLSLMTREQIRYWAGQGIEFGAHSRTHPDLAELSEAKCAEELQGSKDDLENLLGSPVTSFAYPYGQYNEVAYNLVKSNFDLAFGVEEGLNYLRGDPHLLRRIYIGPTDSLLEFILCLHPFNIRTLRQWRVKLAIRTRLKNALKSIFRLVPIRES